MLYPVPSKIGSPFGWRRIDGHDDLHTGIDFAARAGTPVVAALEGTVRIVAAPGEWQRYGRIVVLEHPGSPRALFTLYAHLASSSVRQGEHVAAGQPIATVGDTAGTRAEPDKRTRAPHLHFELLTKWPPSEIDKDRIDPSPYFEAGPVPRVPELPRKAGAGLGVLALLFAWAWAKKSAGHAVRARRLVPVQRYSEGTS